MPEFVLDRGDSAFAKVFAGLDSFTQGYVECMFFTDTSSDSEDLAGATFAELAPDTLIQIIQECADFQELAKANLEVACNHPKITNYTMARAGHDFWLTRNGHGAGFWDRGLGPVGNRLSDDAKSFGSCDMYRGDDKKIYLS